MTEAARTDLSNDRPASPVRERVGSISAGMALGKPVGSGLARFSVVSDKAATGRAANVQKALSICSRVIS